MVDASPVARVRWVLCFFFGLVLFVWLFLCVASVPKVDLCELGRGLLVSVASFRGTWE